MRTDVLNADRLLCLLRDLKRGQMKSSNVYLDDVWWSYSQGAAWAPKVTQTGLYLERRQCQSNATVGRRQIALRHFQRRQRGWVTLKTTPQLLLVRHCLVFSYIFCGEKEATESEWCARTTCLLSFRFLHVISGRVPLKPSLCVRLHTETQAMCRDNTDMKLPA